jgi:MFS family permease
MLVPGGMLVDNYGPRHCVLVGITGLALLLSMYAALVTSFSQVIVAHVAMATVSSISGVPVYSLFIAQWFDEGIGLAMGLTLAGFSLGGTVMPAVLGPVGAEFGWRGAMGCMAAFLWLVGLPVAYSFLDERPEEAEYFDGGGDHSDTEAGRPPPTAEVLPLLTAAGRSPAVAPHPSSVSPRSQRTEPPAAVDNKSWTFLGFALSYILLQYSFGTFAENCLFYLTIDRGWSLALASLFFSAMNLASFSAKLIGGHAGDKVGDRAPFPGAPPALRSALLTAASSALPCAQYDRFLVGSVMSAVASAGVLCLFLDGGIVDGIPRLTHNPVLFAGFSVLYGFGYGATFNCLYCLVPLVFGRKNLGRIQSSLFGLGLVGNAAGSILCGVLRSRYGAYDRGFLIAGAACLANLCVFNVTRATLGGSMQGLKVLQGEEEPVDPKLLAELRADEAALQRRIGGGGLSEVGSTGVTPLGSDGSLAGYGSSGFFGASFRASPSTEQFLNHPSPPTTSPSMPILASSLGDLALGAAATDSCDGTSSTGSFCHDGSPADDGGGIGFSQGFPNPQTWSSGSLQRLAAARRRRRSASRGRLSAAWRDDEHPEASPLRAALLRSSSTAENLIVSGIMSSSLEDVGYAGEAPAMRPPFSRSRSLRRVSPGAAAAVAARPPPSPAAVPVPEPAAGAGGPTVPGHCSPQSFGVSPTLPARGRE